MHNGVNPIARWTCVAKVAAASWLCALAVQSTQGQDVVFDNRANVNVLNASNAVLAAGQGGATVGKLRFSVTDGYWDGQANPPGGTNWISIDFRTARNIKTIRIYQYNLSAATNGVIATSPDGSSWTTRSATWTMTGTQADIVLDTAIDSRYLRVTATDIQDGNGADRWIIYAMRVFGDTGTLTDPDGVIDLISSTGWSGGVTMTTAGISITDTTLAEYVNDALTPLKRQVLYSVSTGDTITLQFDRAFVFQGMGLAPMGNNATGAFDIHMSTNGTDYTLITSHTGVTAMATFFGFIPTRAQYVRLTFLSWDGTSAGYIGDIHLYGLAPTTNRAPLASSQSVMTTLGISKPVTLVATDPDGDPLSWLLIASPAHGMLSGSMPNVTYEPDDGYVGDDVFQFAVTDGSLTSVVAQVSITVHPGGTVVFDSRQNVNLVNASNVVLSAGQGGANLSTLTMAATEGAWDGLANPPGMTNWITIDFRTNRNIKTVRFYHWPAYEATNGALSTSADGASWTPRASTWLMTGANAEIQLGSAVTSRYLRIDATGFTQGNARWVVYCLRAFGSDGMLGDTGGVLDLVSGTGFSGGVTLTRNGTVSITDTTVSEFIDDALYPMKRQVLYNLGTNDGFTLQFDRNLVMKSLGLYLNSFDASATFTVETSLNGASYSNVLTQAGSLAAGRQYFALAPSTGRYLRFTLTSTSSGDNRIGDIQVFGSLPLAPRPKGTVILVQ